MKNIYPPTPAVSRGSASEEAFTSNKMPEGAKSLSAERKPAPDPSFSHGVLATRSLDSSLDRSGAERKLAV